MNGARESQSCCVTVNSEYGATSRRRGDWPGAGVVADRAGRVFACYDSDRLSVRLSSAATGNTAARFNLAKPPLNPVRS